MELVIMFMDGCKFVQLCELNIQEICIRM